MSSSRVKSITLMYFISCILLASLFMKTSLAGKIVLRTVEEYSLPVLMTVVIGSTPTNFINSSLVVVYTHSLDPCLWGESDHPAFSPPASSSITPAGSVHKSRGSNSLETFHNGGSGCQLDAAEQPQVRLPIVIGEPEFFL